MWIWLWYFGKILSMVFLIKEESNDEEEREQLLEEEISEHKQTYIPWTLYLVNGSIEAADVLLICIELFYMNFGLFIIVSCNIIKIVLRDCVCILYFIQQ